MEEGGRTPRVQDILLLAALVISSVGLAGCVDSEQTARLAASAADCTDASGAQNRPGQFQYGGAASCKSGTETFDWENPSPYAEIQYGSGLVAGEISIRILDAQDREVYSGSVAAGGEAEGRQERSEFGVPTAQPVAGTWTIELTFENVTGTLGLQVTSAR